MSDPHGAPPPTSRAPHQSRRLSDKILTAFHHIETKRVTGGRVVQRLNLSASPEDPGCLLFFASL